MEETDMSKKRTDFTRRDFLKTAGAATVGSLLGATETVGKISDSSGKEISVVPTRPFGKTGKSRHERFKEE